MTELKKSAIDSHIWIIYLLALVLAVVLWYFQWPLGLILFIFVLLSFSYTIQKEKRRRKETGEYIAALSHRVQRVGDEALLEMPFGIVLYNEEFEVEWSNPYMNDLNEEGPLTGLSLDEVSEELIPMINEE